MRYFKGDSGQSLVETAIALPVLVMLMAYAVDFGYFYVVASNLTTSARVAAEYSVEGSATVAQGSLPATGISTTTQNTVSNTVLNDDVQLTGSATGTAIQVCSKALGTTGNVTNCGQYGASNTNTYTPQTDPEAGTFYLNRVDVTYTIKPPIPLTFFNVSFLPPLQFHRSVVMRVMD